jgi:SRSO17 transposase
VKTKVYLIIDDSLVEKTGKQMEGVAKHSSHKDNNKLVLGHVWVTAQLVVAGYSYPLDWAVYRRQSECEQSGSRFISKPDITYNMIQAYQPLPDTQTVVMTDSWYVSQDILALCKQRAFQFIGAVKSNRKVKIGFHNQQVKQWRDVLPKSRLERVKVKDSYYKVWTPSQIGTLSCAQTVKLLVNRRIGVKKWHYLISTDLSLSAQAILASYFIRWEVENFYRAAKQILGWGDYQMRDLVAIENHVLLMMVTHAYLEIQRRDALEQATEGEAYFTLGDLQRQHQRLAQRATISLVFALTQQGLDLDDIYERLAA